MSADPDGAAVIETVEGQWFMRRDSYEPGWQLCCANASVVRFADGSGAITMDMLIETAPALTIPLDATSVAVFWACFDFMMEHMPGPRILKSS